MLTFNMAHSSEVDTTSYEHTYQCLRKFVNGRLTVQMNDGTLYHGYASALIRQDTVRLATKDAAMSKAQHTDLLGYLAIESNDVLMIIMSDKSGPKESHLKPTAKRTEDHEGEGPENRRAFPGPRNRQPFISRGVGHGGGRIPGITSSESAIRRSGVGKGRQIS